MLFSRVRRIALCHLTQLRSMQNATSLERLSQVKGEIATACKNRPLPTLVAVSKTVSADAIRELHEAAGQEHFGENYVQEFIEKAPTLPESIKWHFIGHLQTNKAKKVLAIKNLWVIETVDSPKLAQTLSKTVAADPDREKLNIFVQVNTSREEQKSGLDPESAVALSQDIFTNKDGLYDSLVFKGLMTIGKLDGDPVADFQELVNCRKKVAEVLKVDENSLELSMGMSGDFKQAVEMGSTNVRVGSLIFGSRPPK